MTARGTQERVWWKRRMSKCHAMIEILRRVGLQTRIVDYTPNLYEYLYEIYARTLPTHEAVAQRV